MSKIDLHKLVLAVGFEIVCVEDDCINYEYMVRVKDIESISYVLKIKNNPNYSEVDNIINSIIIVLPNNLKRKIKKLMRKRDKENINNIIDLLCYTVTQYKNKTKYGLLKEYGNLLGIEIEDYGYHFTYKISKVKYAKIISLIESKLTVEEALVLGKIRKLEYKISCIKQRKSLENQPL